MASSSLIPFFKMAIGGVWGILQLYTVDHSSVLADIWVYLWLEWSTEVIESSFEERVTKKKKENFRKSEDLGSSLVI